MRPEATLVLEDGTILQGEGFGASGEVIFELVFNTSLGGYEEILSDASYRGQAVVFTNPHIGNTGVNLEDMESDRVQAAAVVVRSLSPLVSNYRSQTTLAEWLNSYGVPGISGVDTRRLTRILRESGTMKAALATNGVSGEALLEKVRTWGGLDGQDKVREVSCPESYLWTPDEAQKRWVGVHPVRHRVAVVDYGIKRNILRMLSSCGAEVHVFPAWATAAEVLSCDPDGLFLSNGPGDPAGIPYAVETVKGLLASGLPLFGICLGHQLVGHAIGGRTGRLKFGHHGGNHPVQDCATKAVLITAHNHNFALDATSLDTEQVEITHLSLNDGTLEGMRLRGKPVFTVQFHPEAATGPHDAQDLFHVFFGMLAEKEAS